MRGIDKVRIGWVIGTTVGTGFVLTNLREALVDLRAVNQSPRRTVAVLQMQARGLVWDQTIKLVALVADVAIGLIPPTEHSRLTNNGKLYRQRYVLQVGLLVMNAACLVFLSWMQNRRRHKISQALRLRARMEDKNGNTR